MEVRPMSNPWISTADRLPPEGEAVETKLSPPDRNHASLVRKGNLWFFEDMSMYVYYRPTHWRAGSPAQEGGGRG